MPTYTTHFTLAKPLVNDATDQDLWGGELNDDMDTIDSALWTAQQFVTRAVTTTDSATTADKKKLLLCDATSAAFTETLPAAASAGDGFTIAIKKTDATAHAVTIDGNGSETIDGSLTLALSSQNDSVILVCNGSNWYSIARDPVVIPDASDTVKGIIEIATSAEVLAASSTVLAVTPGRMADHYGVAKGMVKFSGTTGTLSTKQGNVSSTSRTGTGAYTITLSGSLSEIYVTLSWKAPTRTNSYMVDVQSASGTTITLQSQVQSAGAADVTDITAVIFGVA